MAVDLATKSLLHDKLRFLITVSGVAFAVTLVFVQVGLFLGLMDNASLTIEHLDADLWVTSHNTANIDFSHTFTETYVKRVRSIDGVARADNLIVWFMNVSLPNGAVEGTEVYALEDFTRWNFPWNIVDGNITDLRRGHYMYLTVFLGCLVGIVVVAQTLYTSTMEHIKEFGTVKAIGGGNADIYSILAKQATIAAVAGFALGAVMSYALRPVIQKIDLKLVIPTPLSIAVFIGSIVLCLAAAMISFRKVASIDPALVFRT